MSMQDFVHEAMMGFAARSPRAQAQLSDVVEWPPPPPVLARFFEKVWMPNLEDCWLWSGAANPDGYGTFRMGDKFFNTHRFVMMCVTGRILTREEVVDHLCRIKQCCNPLHLEVVSVSVNTKRGYDADPGVTW